MDQEEINMYLEDAKEKMDFSIDHLHKELGKISTGKANPAMVKDLLVSYYGSPTPMSQVANVSNSDARTLVIQPWEKAMLAPIEKSIFEANMGVTPQNDGDVVRIFMPPLTEERRKLLAKQAKALGEEAKVSIRTIRRDIMETIKKAVKDGYSEDDGKRMESNVQEMTDGHTAKIGQVCETKEKDIMKI
jgi:ribosome recycling factor